MQIINNFKPKLEYLRDNGRVVGGQFLHELIVSNPVVLFRSLSDKIVTNVKRTSGLWTLISPTENCGFARAYEMVLRIMIFVLFLSQIIMSQSIINTLPGYPNKLPFKLKTGYIGIGETEDVHLFYYFIESERNPTNDPLIIWISGGPDQPVGTGFSYADSFDAWKTSDTLSATQTYNFLKKGYMIGNPFTDKINDLYSRVQFAHRLALLSDELFKSFEENCLGDYSQSNSANAFCQNDLKAISKAT
ncbi:hypothetical protein LguiA_010795 [Lonicera macranthoides]